MWLTVMINNRRIQAEPPRHSALPRRGTPASCCSFEMIRASFATRVGKRGVFTLYMDRRGPRSQRVSARTTDQREIRCERQTVAAAYQPAHRRTSRQGSGQVRHPPCAESDLARKNWQGQSRTSRPSPSACNSRAAKILPVAAQPASKPAVRPQTPDIRDDTRKE
jgi:hypothetical protein